MQALDEVRTAEIEMDMELSPVEECYAFLQRCGVAVPREEIERVDSLRYTFKNLQSQACAVQSHLVTIQQNFKKDLKESVEVFKEDLDSFTTTYNQVVPTHSYTGAGLSLHDCVFYAVGSDGRWTASKGSQRKNVYISGSV